MTETAQKPSEYGADSIKVLKGLEAVRKRPGMYIGDTDDGSGLHHMVYEVVDNGIDEALAGHATAVTVKIHADDSVSVRDNGRGIPVDIHAEEGVSAAEVIMTQLHAGGKFNNTDEGGNAYKVSGGLHGVGVSVVNALSEWLELTVWRNDKEYRARFEDGECTVHVHEVGPAPGMRGTEVRFLASAKINRPDGTFSDLDYQFKTLETRLRELAFLNSGVRIILEDERHPELLRTELFYEGGVREFVKYLDRSKQAVMAEPIYMTGERSGIKPKASSRKRRERFQSCLRRCTRGRVMARVGDMPANAGSLQSRAKMIKYDNIKLLEMAMRRKNGLKNIQLAMAAVISLALAACGPVTASTLGCTWRTRLPPPCPSRAPRQPVTMTRPLAASASPIVSRLSFTASSMKPQVLTITRSAPS